MASITCAIKMPTLKITRKLSNQTLTFTSVLEVNIPGSAQSKKSRREPRFERQLRIQCHICEADYRQNAKKRSVPTTPAARSGNQMSGTSQLRLIATD